MTNSIRAFIRRVVVLVVVVVTQKGPACHFISEMQAIIVGHLYGMDGESLLRHGRVYLQASIIRRVTEASTERPSRMDGASRASPWHKLWARLSLAIGPVVRVRA